MMHAPLLYYSIDEAFLSVLLLAGWLFPASFGGRRVCVACKLCLQALPVLAACTCMQACNALRVACRCGWISGIRYVYVCSTRAADGQGLALKLHR